MFWWQLIIWAVSTIAYQLIRPKPKFENARPSSLGEFQFPTATEGRAVPLLWGTALVKGANLVWYGDFKKEARTEEVKTSMFSSETVILGYRYYVGMHFALCQGPGVKLTKITLNDNKGGWTGSLTTDGATAAIDNPDLFGGEEHGSGGITGEFAFYTGSITQAADSYLTLKLPGATPGFRGIAHVVWRGGWIGNSNNVVPWAFQVTRVPDGLNMAAADPGAEEPVAGDANPMNVLYEILTNTDWGLAIPSSEIDIDNFQDAASLLAAEGNGFSLLLDSPTQISSVIDDIQRQVDGSLYYDRVARQWKMNLARDNYVLGNLKIFDQSNILVLKEFTRQTWEETTNQVRISFVDRNDNYKSTFAIAQDQANIDIQGASVQVDSSYPGVTNKTTANLLAWRDLKASSYPLSKLQMTVNREMWDLAPGDVFKFTWASLGITEGVYRVGKINYGKVGSSEIDVFAIEDVFSTDPSSYSDPVDSGWTDSPNEPGYPEIAESLIFEAPAQIVAQDPYAPTQNPRIWMGARNPGGGTVSLKSYHKVGTTPPPGGAYAADANIRRFAVTGTLDANLAAYGTGPTRPDTSYTITIDEVDNLANIVVDGDSSLIGDLATICYCEGEFFGFEKAEALGGGQYRLSRLWRGLFDSAPAAHPSGAIVWFVSQGGALSRRVLQDTQDEMRTQLRGVDGFGNLTTEMDTPEIDTSLTRIYLDPLPPRDPYLNNVYADLTAVSIDASYPTETGRTGDDARALEVKVTPRDWRVLDPLTDTTLTASWTSDSPSLEVTLTVGGTPVGPYISTNDSTPQLYVLRNDIIIELGANTVIPTTADLSVVAKHNPARTAKKDMTLDSIAIVSSLQGADDITHGGVALSASPAVTYGETGNYAFDIFTALPTTGRLEARKNAGAWTTVVAAGNTTGTLSVTAGDSVELRMQNDQPNADQFFTVTGPTAELGYGVLLA